MIHRLISHGAFAAIIACATTTALVSCRKNQTDNAASSAPVGKIAPELLSNKLHTLPGAVYQSLADSPIRWQAWTKDTLERAREARRLVFCVIAMPQQPGFYDVLQALASDPAQVDNINDTYVPVLVDGDAAREMSILTSDLCVEINRSLNLPLFVWLTHEGNPVAWIPVPRGERSSILDLFHQSHTMVSQMWQDVPEYVLKNSSIDNENRRARIQQRKNVKVMSHQPAEDVVRCLRQLSSLYDPLSRSFDETGGLFPSGALELLSAAAVHPGLPDDVRGRCQTTARELLKDLLPSAMFDPLDGGVFSSRRSSSWSLPTFVKDCPSQSRVAMALLEAYRATGDAHALRKALGVIDFAEQNHSTPEELFSVGFTKLTPPEKWMWSVEEIRNTLAPEDADWWIEATGVKGLGNLPSEVDPRRDFFRANTLSMASSPAELAAARGESAETFVPRFEAARAKLLAARNNRLGKIQPDQQAHAPSTFRMVSAYAAAFCATGEEKYREKAKSLLERARAAFAVGPRLRVFAADAPASVATGRNFHYALALQAVLDVAAITSEEKWRVWAEDLATTAAELFTGDQLLKECPDDAKIIDLPITDLVMLFDDSTAGLMSMTECRLAGIGRPLVASFSELAIPLPTYAVERPVLHTDLLMATIARHYAVTAVCGADLSPEMKLAVERLPLRMAQRRPARPDEQVPAGSVRVLLGEEKRAVTVSTPQQLQQAVLPATENSGNLTAPASE